MELNETTKTCFELAIQWMISGKIILPAACRGGPEAIAQLVGFMKFADLLSLLGPFDSVLAMLRKQVLSHPDALSGRHIREVAELP